MRTPNLQPVQILGLDVDGELKPLATPRFGTPSDTDNGALRAAPFGDNASGGDAGYASFFTVNDFAGIDPANLLGAVGVGFSFGLDAGGVIRALPVILPTDGLDETALYGSPRQAIGYGFNGTAAAGLDRLRTASSVNLDPAATAHPGVQMTAKIAEWTAFDVPAVNTQASVTKAAVAGARHVVTSISGSLMAVAAITARMNLQLQDATLSTLWNQSMIAAAGTCVHVELGGLSIVGAVNSAMTIKFGAGPGATNYQTVAMTGYTIS